MKTLIGTGALSWWRTERISNRYGSVALYHENSLGATISDGERISKDTIKPLLGQQGKLIAEVTHTRESTHIGDLFRGLSPSTPSVGDVFVLGEGTFFSEPIIEDNKLDVCVGVEPTDGRDEDWLDPNKLYQVHEQTVNLYFEH